MCGSRQKIISTTTSMSVTTPDLCLSVSLSVCLCLCLCLSACLSICLSICLPVCLSVCVSVFVYIYILEVRAVLYMYFFWACVYMPGTLYMCTCNIHLRATLTLCPLLSLPFHPPSHHPSSLPPLPPSLPSLPPSLLPPSFLPPSLSQESRRQREIKADGNNFMKMKDSAPHSPPPSLLKNK